MCAHRTPEPTLLPGWRQSRLSQPYLAPVGQFAFLITRARQALTTMDSLQKMMEQEDERQGSARSVVPEIRIGKIELNNVNFRYPGSANDNLSDLNLKFEPGERVGIIGRVASGKSTLGRVLCGLYAPTDGVMSATPYWRMSSTKRTRALT